MYMRSWFNLKRTLITVVVVIVIVVVGAAVLIAAFQQDNFWTTLGEGIAPVLRVVVGLFIGFVTAVHAIAGDWVGIDKADTIRATLNSFDSSSFVASAPYLKSLLPQTVNQLQNAMHWGMTFAVIALLVVALLFFGRRRA
jgi:hypothetical protein